MYRPYVAVIDSGIDLRNKELKSCLKSGMRLQYSDYSFVEESLDYNDDYGHGTNCVDLIHSLCPQAVFFSIKIVNDSGQSTSELLIAALKKCTRMPIKIICVSLSVTKKNCFGGNILEDVCKELNSQGKIICVSAHNTTANSIPASYRSVLGVGADYHLEKGLRLERNQAIQVIADGRPVFMAGKNGRFNFFKGTSKANAYVTGLVARQLCESPDDNLAKILDKLEIMADKQNYVLPMEYHRGQLQQDEEGQRILDSIAFVLKQVLGCTKQLEVISNNPLISKTTGLNYFNFFDFIQILYRKNGITEPDYHQLRIAEVCTVYNLTEHIRRKVYEEKKRSLSTD